MAQKPQARGFRKSHVVMLFRTEGIVIKTFEYGEADLIVTFFTTDKGKIKGIARSSRKTKSRFGSSLEPFTHSRISLYGKENAALPKITQSDIIHSHRTLREDLSKLAYGAQMAELINELCPEAEENRGVFSLFSSILSAMESDSDLERLSLLFEILFLGIMGYQPRLNSCVICNRKGGGLNFYPNHGGIICSRCSKPEEGSFPLSPETKDIYYKVISYGSERISGSKFVTETGSYINLKVRGELKTILSLHLNHILGKKLRSTATLSWAT